MAFNRGGGGFRPGGNRGGFNRGGGGGGFRRSFPREMTKIKCSECGKEDEVPFKPREGTPVYCRECFMKKKGITPRRSENSGEANPEEGSESEESESEEEY